MGELSQLKGLSAKSEAQLNAIGIYTREDLIAVGPINIFLKLRESNEVAPSLHFLYAIVGAIKNVHWLSVAQRERKELLEALDDVEQFKKIFPTLIHESTNKEINK